MEGNLALANNIFFDVADGTSAGIFVVASEQDGDGNDLYTVTQAELDAFAPSANWAAGWTRSLGDVNARNNPFVGVEDLERDSKAVSVYPNPVFDVAYNELTELPEELSGLHYLQGFYASGNMLSEFPEQILLLPLLDRVDLSENRITEIPGEIVRMDQLKKLDMGENKLTDLPPPPG